MRLHKYLLLPAMSLAGLFLFHCTSGTSTGGCKENPNVCGAGLSCDVTANTCVLASGTLDGGGSDGSTSGDAGSDDMTGGPADLSMPPGSGTSCSSDKFCFENPLPSGNHLASVFRLDNNNTWVVGALGTIV